MYGFEAGGGYWVEDDYSRPRSFVLSVQRYSSLYRLVIEDIYANLKISEQC